MSFPFPVTTIADLPNNATPPTTSLIEIDNAGVSENTSIAQMLNTAGVELQTNKGAVSGYAGLDASQQLLIDNFPAGNALEFLRRNAANTALEFAVVDVSPLTTKGDIFTYDTDDARLPVGTNGQVLTANSATATGLEWVDAAGQTPWISNIDGAGFALLDANYIEVGSSLATPFASVGEVRMPAEGALAWRNDADDADFRIYSTSDELTIEGWESIVIPTANVTLDLGNAALSGIETLELNGGGSMDLGDTPMFSLISIQFTASNLDKPIALGNTQEVVWEKTGGTGYAGIVSNASDELLIGFSATNVGPLTAQITISNTQVSFGNVQLKAVSDPTDGSDAATKSYVDSLVNGLSWKNPAVLATTGNITLSGNQTIDGTLTVTGDRVLVKDQTTGSENGVYNADAGAWTRTEDTDSEEDLVNMSIYITKGTVNEDTAWVLTTDPPITVGVTDLDYAQVGAGTGNPLTTKGDIFGYDTANARIPVGSDNQFLMADSVESLGVKYSLVNNINLAAGIFSNIQGLGTQGQSLNMGNNTITGVANGGITFNSGESITAGGTFLTLNVGAGDFVVVNVNATNEYFFGATEADFQGNQITDAKGITFIGDATLPGATFTYIQEDAANSLIYNAVSTGTHDLRIAQVSEYLFSATTADFQGNSITDLGGFAISAGNGDMNGGELQNVNVITFDTANNDLRVSGGVNINNPNGQVFKIRFNSADVYNFDQTEFDMGATNLVNVLNVTLNSGGKLTVDSDATEAGFRDAGHTADPSSPAAGDLYYNTTTNVFRWYNGTIWQDIGSGGGGSQTPWTSDIDADGFDLTDLSNIEFRATTGAPAAGTQAIYNNADIAMTFNVPTADVFRWTVQGVLGMQLNNLTLNLQNTTSLSQVNGLTMQGILTINTAGGGYISMNAIASPGNSGLATRGSIFMDSGNSNHLTIRRNDGIDVDLEAGGGTGDVVGPGSSTDNAIALFDGVTGKLIQNSSMTFDQGGTSQLTIPGPIILSAAGTVPAGTNTYLREDANDLDINVNAANDINIQFGGTPQYTFSNTQADFTGNNLINAVLTVASTLSNTTVTTGLSYGNGIKQTFNPSTSNAGINVGAETSDPSVPVNGDIYYNSSANELRARINGVWVDIGAGGSQTPWTSDIDADGFDLRDLSNVEFRTTTLAPAGTVQAIWADAGGIIMNVPTGDTFIMRFNGSTRYTFGTNDVTFLNRDLLQVGTVSLGTGTNLSASGYEMWTDNASFMAWNVPTGDEYRYHINGVETMSISATVVDLINGKTITNAGNIFMENNTGSVELRLENTASTPIVGQFAGIINYRGDRVSSSSVDYGRIAVEMIDVSSGSADGEMIFSALQNNALTEYMTLNEASSQTIHFKADVQDFNMENTVGTGDIRQLLGLTFNDDTTQLAGSIAYLQRTNTEMYLNAPTGETIVFGINNVDEISIASNLVTLPAGTDLNAGGDVIVGDRFQGQKGADVASADAITLGDGNYFDITGAVTINHMINTNWQAGSVVTLQFDAGATVTNAAGGAAGAEQDFALAGAANFVATAGDTLTLVNDGTLWREIARSVN